MLSPSASSMTKEEMAAWNAYRLRRTTELKEQGLNQDGINDRQAWFEFVQYKWGLLLNTGSSPLDGITMASKVSDFGPDLMGIGRFIRIEPVPKPKPAPKSPRKPKQSPKMTYQKPKIPSTVQAALERTAQARNSQIPISSQSSDLPPKNTTLTQPMPEIPARPAVPQINYNSSTNSAQNMIAIKQTADSIDLKNRYRNAFIVKMITEKCPNGTSMEKNKALLDACIEWNNMTSEQRNQEIVKLLVQKDKENTKPN